MKFLLISLIVLLTYQESPKIENFKSPVILELFTSQGCSSCPPADELISEISEKFATTEVIVLSYHVDYWNYIGWTDPFSKSQFSDKQKAYGRKFNNSSIYTPQIIVNGKEHFVGSNESTLYTKIRTYSKLESQNRVLLSNVNRERNFVSFEYDIEGTIQNKHLEIALVINERSTSIPKGENKNMTLKNSKIVIEQLKVNLNSTMGKGTINIPELVNSEDNLSLIILIQNSDLDILGAHQLNL